MLQETVPDASALKECREAGGEAILRSGGDGLRSAAFVRWRDAAPAEALDRRCRRAAPMTTVSAGNLDENGHQLRRRDGADPVSGLILQGALLGIGANILFDLWQRGLAVASGQPAPDWAPIGRWFWHLRRGKVFHDDIGRAESYAHERALGWVGHYMVGIIYGVIFALIAGPGWLAAPRFLPAWIFALVTVGFGWFLLQPGLGLGWAASKTPNPTKVRLLNLAAHTVFGLGLYLTGLLIR